MLRSQCLECQDILLHGVGGSEGTRARMQVDEAVMVRSFLDEEPTGVTGSSPSPKKKTQRHGSPTGRSAQAASCAELLQKGRRKAFEIGCALYVGVILLNILAQARKLNAPAYLS